MSAPRINYFIQKLPERSIVSKRRTIKRIRSLSISPVSELILIISEYRILFGNDTQISNLSSFVIFTRRILNLCFLLFRSSAGLLGGFRVASFVEAARFFDGGTRALGTSSAVFLRFRLTLLSLSSFRSIRILVFLRIARVKVDVTCFFSAPVSLGIDVESFGGESIGGGLERKGVGQVFLLSCLSGITYLREQNSVPAILLLPFRADLYSLQKCRSFSQRGRYSVWGEKASIKVLVFSRSVDQFLHVSTGMLYRFKERGIRARPGTKELDILYLLFHRLLGSAQNSSRLNVSTVFVENTRMVAAASA